MVSGRVGGGLGGVAKGVKVKVGTGGLEWQGMG